MNGKAVDNTSYIRLQTDLVNERSAQRLKEDLGLDDEAVEVIMNLRDQVNALQRRLRELESTLEIYQSGYSSRLTRYRLVYQEAIWEDTR